NAPTKRQRPIGQDTRPGKAGWLLVPELTYWRVRDGNVEPWEADPISMLLRYARTHGLKTAFLFHDLIPLRVPDYRRLRTLHERYVRRLAHADLILPVSAHAGSDLASYFRETLQLDEGSVPSIVPHPLPHEFLGHPRETTSDVPTAGPITLMCVSHIEPRKN